MWSGFTDWCMIGVFFFLGSGGGVSGLPTYFLHEARGKTERNRERQFILNEGRVRGTRGC